MENSHQESNSLQSVDLGEKEKRSFTMTRVDASIIILVLTALTYICGMKYKEGYLGYYGISNFMIGSVEINFLINSFLHLLIPLLIGGLLYLWVLPSLFNSKFKSKKYGRLPYFSLLILFFWSFFVAYLYYVFNILVNRGISLFVMVTLALNFKKRFYRTITLPVINHITNKISPFISFIVKHTPVKFIALMIFICVMVGSFIRLGENSARDREEYLIIEHGKSNYAVITENSNNLLIAKVDIDKKVIYANYSIIEAKSEFNELVNLKPEKFNGGLKVKRVKIK
ncbi:hypothetical protein [Priestia aryabhattai]|uniref:hypothetical protein n=1 Tax=Priestia aryabhattai TaxID=412384 RepID=UPI003D2DD630